MNRKICFLMETPFTNGGEQRVVTILANYLNNNKYDVSFILTTYDKSEDKSIFGMDKNINIIYLKHKYILIEKIMKKIINMFTKLLRGTKIYKSSLKLQRISYSMFNKEIQKIIIGNKFDYVIGVASEHFSTLANIKDNLSNTKIIAWQHSCFNSYFSTKGWRLNNQNEFIKYLFKKTDYYVCQTNDDKNRIIEEFNYNPIVINNPNTFCKMDKKSTRKDKTFLAVGRIDKVKGFDKLIDAFNEFSKQNEEWNLYIIGDGPLREELVEKVKKYNLTNRVFLPGSTKDIAHYYMSSSVYCMTSAWEGWGMVVTEAMQYGLPIISFDIPSTREIFGEYECGIIIEKDNINKLCEAMLICSKNNELLNNYSNNCLIRVKSFDVDKVGEEWKKILS